MSNPIDHIEAAIMFIRACGPVTKESLAQEILAQVSTATTGNYRGLAEKAVEHGLSTGWLKRYDDESFCIR